MDCRFFGASEQIFKKNSNTEQGSVKLSSCSSNHLFRKRNGTEIYATLQIEEGCSRNKALTDKMYWKSCVIYNSYRRRQIRCRM